MGGDEKSKFGPKSGIWLGVPEVENSKYESCDTFFYFRSVPNKKSPRSSLGDATITKTNTY